MKIELDDDDYRAIANHLKDKIIRRVETRQLEKKITKDVVDGLKDMIIKSVLREIDIEIITSSIEKRLHDSVHKRITKATLEDSK